MRLGRSTVTIDAASLPQEDVPGATSAPTIVMPPPVVVPVPAPAPAPVQPAGSVKIRKIVVHHTVTPRNATVEDIRRIHVQGNGWSDIGYHWLLRSYGGSLTIEPGRKDNGDPWIEGDEIGAHAYAANAYALGIAMIGNFHEEEVPSDMYDALVDWLGGKCAALGLVADDIVGHCEADAKLGTVGNATVCPGQHMDLYRLRQDVANRLAAE